jgi:hypothetical protein
MLREHEWSRVTGEGTSVQSDQPKLDITYEMATKQFFPKATESNGEQLRFPTEGEWEFACRAGTTGVRYAELAEIAWAPGESRVGTKKSNALGFYEMIGHGFQRCSDLFNESPQFSEYKECARGVVDPMGPAKPIPVRPVHIVRGGFWKAGLESTCRASSRLAFPESPMEKIVGLRVARNPYGKFVLRGHFEYRTKAAKGATWAAQFAGADRWVEVSDRGDFEIVTTAGGPTELKLIMTCESHYPTAVTSTVDLKEGVTEWNLVIETGSLSGTMAENGDRVIAEHSPDKVTKLTIVAAPILNCAFELASLPAGECTLRYTRNGKFAPTTTLTIKKDERATVELK